MTRLPLPAPARSATAAPRPEPEPFHVMRVLAAARRRAERGLPVFDLTAGQPSTPAPAPVLAAAHRALDEHVLGYTESTGIPQLREAICGHYRRRYGLDVGPGSVVVTTGSSGGFLLAFLAAFGPGARVGLARPGYPAYRNLLTALGYQVVDLPCGAEQDYRWTAAGLDAALAAAEAQGGPLDGLVLASPANPTGTSIGPADLAAVAATCARRGIRLVSDEIYHGMTYTGRSTSAWESDRTTVVANSFSKYFSMTGWRIGWLLGPDDLHARVDALAGNLAICPPAPSQYAAVHAFAAYDECDAHVRRYARNRSLLLDGLATLGIDRVAPADGAFYVYADVAAFTDDTLQWCADLLERTGVACAPGIDFDPVAGSTTVRFCFAGEHRTIEGALEALARVVR